MGRGCLALICLLAVPAQAAPTRALYGLDSRKPPFKGNTPAQIAEWLVRHRFNAVFGGYRNRRLVSALRRRAIKVYAEIPLFVGAKHWKRHPESRPITAQGRRLKRAGWYAGVCPNQPWLGRAKLKQIERTVRRYRVDGVWLDFIRYPLRWERRMSKPPNTCFCPVCLKLFQSETKIQIPTGLAVKARAQWILRNHRDRFTNWKTDRIADFVRRARTVAHRVNPNLLIGVFVVPWRSDQHDGAITAVVGQDFRKLAPLVDMLSPMTYHRMQGQKPEWIAGFTKYLHRLTHKPVLPVVQACSVPDRLTDKEFAAAVGRALASPSSGIVVFSQRHFAREKRGAAWRAAVETP